MQNSPGRELEGFFRVPHDDPPKWLLMYYAYLDETGQQGKEWVFIAGFLGKEDGWKKFTHKWKEALGPQRKSLHMADLRFKRHSEKRLLERLGPVPVESGLIPVLGGIRIDHYEDIFEGDEFQEKMNNGYTSALELLVIQILKWLPRDERFEIVLEQQDRYCGLANFSLQNFSSLDLELCSTSDGKPRLAKWSFLPKRSSMLTEAADYLAYALGQYSRDPASLRSRWCSPLINSVDNCPERLGAILGREQSRQMFSDILAGLKDAKLDLPTTAEAFEQFRSIANENLKLGHHRA